MERDKKDLRIHSADGPEDGYGNDPERTFWRHFAEASTPVAFCRSWLPLQCRMLGSVRCAMVLLGPADTGPFTPIALWPDPKINMTHLAVSAERALQERRGLLVEGDTDSDRDSTLPQSYHVAYPIEISGKLHGVVVLEVGSPARHQLQFIMRNLHWGAAWLEVLIRRNQEVKSAEENERLQRVLDLVTSAVEFPQFQQAAMAFVTRLSTMFECDRVSLGFLHKGRVAVKVLSHSAHFGRETNLIGAIGSAMEEAVDQRAVVIYPPFSDSPPLVTLEHKKLSREHRSGAILSIPLESQGKTFGGLTLERPLDKPFSQPVVEACKTAALVAGPILALKEREERLLVVRIWDSLAIQAQRLIGPGYLLRKSVLIILIVAALFFSFFKTEYRVTATTSIEGVIQRVVAAPFNGYVKEALVRPGDVVGKGAELCLLDDRDLRLEQIKWQTEKEQFTKQFQQAMAKHERAQFRILSAKVEQAEAQIGLVQEQLARTKIVAPFDGVIMSGDLSQSLGAPVERGQVLFEIAPLNAYRVIADVDERDIGEISVGQLAEILFSSIPGEAFPFVVERVTPVSTAKEGRNYFRVEGKMEISSGRLRPGMEGVGKITIDRRRLIWIWTHDAIDWLRLQVWRWKP
ncbi:MAG: HlyD family efflux transporter periplasmic adaptor subunit [Desulfobacteraceae bacterium]|nr:MAG: HlyD family efflux transporter periplasmic adaptor subunit [Desulfobacteraceae bacterium]